VTIQLLTFQTRVALAIVAVVLIAAAVILSRKGRGTIASILLVGVVGCAGVLAAEGLVALTVRLAAPRAADFNEFRWVLLAPWGRRGLWLGVIACGRLMAYF